MKKIQTSLFIKYMVIFVGVLLLTNLIATSIAFLFFGFTDIPVAPLSGSEMPPTFSVVLRVGGISLVFGSIFISIATKVVLKPINRLSDAAKKVALGDFSVQIPIGSVPKDEITLLMDTFNLMVRELSKNEYLHKDFISNVSHEFKTPITAIQGYAEMLSTSNLSSEKRIEYANIIKRQSARLAKLSSDLLRLSELENKSIAVKHDIFSLDEQIRDAILLLQNEWEQKNIEINANLANVRFHGDKALLYQVWLNLLNNAIRYTNENGQIQIDIYSSEDKISIIIKDNGIGMTSEQVERIFERFYRADTSRNSNGNGLGMSIVKRIIDLHGGEIKVTSSQNIGTAITILFENQLNAMT